MPCSGPGPEPTYSLPYMLLRDLSLGGKKENYNNLHWKGKFIGEKEKQEEDPRCATARVELLSGLPC